MRGWKALIVLLGLIVVFCAIGTWTFIAWIAPLVFSTAQLWPSGPDDLWRWLCIGGTIAGIVLGFTIDESTLGGFDPLFTVTAEYDTPSGRRRAEDRIVTSPADAPVTGGTVVLWYSGNGSDTENIDIVEDPGSIRDPDAAKTYEAPTV